MKEVIVRDYGESNALDYIPGAEVLKTSDQIKGQSEGKAESKSSCTLGRFLEYS